MKNSSSAQLQRSSNVCTSDILANVHRSDRAGRRRTALIHSLLEMHSRKRERAPMLFLTSRKVQTRCIVQCSMTDTLCANYYDLYKQFNHCMKTSKCQSKTHWWFPIRYPLSLSLLMAKMYLSTSAVLNSSFEFRFGAVNYFGCP